MVLLGAAALAVAQPVATLGAPPAGVPAYRAVSATHRAASAPAELSGAHDSFRVPFDVNVGPKTLPNASPSEFLPSRWREWQSVPGYGYQPACYPTPVVAPAPMTETTIGSLVDGRSEGLFSATPHTAGLASPSSGSTASSALTLQYGGLQSTPCGAANFFNL